VKVVRFQVLTDVENWTNDSELCVGNA